MAISCQILAIPIPGSNGIQDMGAGHFRLQFSVTTDFACLTYCYYYLITIIVVVVSINTMLNR